jgi:phosphopantothenoylcysteine decarboxylase/phosphopantothenate--cysteine ligase
MSQKKIILAVTGSIAAYKSAFLTRLLIKEGFQVQVLMTSSAQSFISPLTFSTLSKRPVHIDVSNADSWNNHVEMGLWADVMLIAPATANTIAKMANGICDNMVTATYLSAKCPVYIAPAMDLDMWKHPATKANLQKLQSFGNHIIPVGNGELASGLVGDGRMAEPEDIVQFISGDKSKLPFSGKKALVTAGPTYEKIDPVRFIGNHSSGKMGVAIATSLADQGALVELVLGPSKLTVTHENIHVTRVESAAQMHAAAEEYFPSSDLVVLAAAVADYRPREVANQKIKKKEDSLSIQLEKTIDIAASLGKKKRKGQIIIGFALETNNEEANAIDKLKRKNFDLIVLNSLQDQGAGFNHDTNKVTIFSSTGKKFDFDLKEKAEVADDILAIVKDIH